jgi:leucyl-tRNA synthetase
VGVKKFVEKFYSLKNKVVDDINKEKRQQYLSLLHQTIKKVGFDIENFKFNTAVSALMILVNKLEKSEQILKKDFQNLIIITAPFAPFVCEELNELMGNEASVFKQEFPLFDPNLIISQSFILPVQVNGKIREKIEISQKIKSNKEEIIEIAREKENVKKYLEGKEIKKIIYVEGRILNIIV